MGVRGKKNDAIIRMWRGCGIFFLQISLKTKCSTMNSERKRPFQVLESIRRQVALFTASCFGGRSQKAPHCTPISTFCIQNRHESAAGSAPIHGTIIPLPTWTIVHRQSEQRRRWMRFLCACKATMQYFVTTFEGRVGVGLRHATSWSYYSQSSQYL